MSVENYWMGKDIDLDALWRDFDAAREYEDKVARVPRYLLRLTFRGHPQNLPLFDHEVIYKTVKGTFHDVKEDCFPPDVYDSLTPIFLHRIERGSGIFEFLAQLDPLLTWVVALGSAAYAGYRTAIFDAADFDEKRLEFLRSHFPNASAADKVAYLKAWTSLGRHRVLSRLLGAGLHRVEVSKEPVTDTTMAVDTVNMNPVLQIPSNTATGRSDE